MACWTYCGPSFARVYGFILSFLDFLLTWTSENDTLARIGTSCLQQLLQSNARQLSPTDWERVITTFVWLFKTTTPYQLFDESLRADVEQGEQADMQGKPELYPMLRFFLTSLKIKLILPCSLRPFRLQCNQHRHQLGTHPVIENVLLRSLSPNVFSNSSSSRPPTRCFKMKTSTRRYLLSIYCASCRFWMLATSLRDRSMQIKRSGMDYGVLVGNLDLVPLTAWLMVSRFHEASSKSAKTREQ